MTTIQPRKQRKALATAPLHVRRKQIAAHLCEELLLKYKTRSTPVVVGDEVLIMRGGHKGTTGKVVEVRTKARKLVIDGVNNEKADGTAVPLPVDPSNVLIKKLNLEDNFRRAKLGDEE